jgi:hypothetical protein
MPDSLLERARVKIRYYGTGLPLHQAVLRIVIDSFSRLAIRVEPFEIFLEGLSRATKPVPPPDLTHLETVFLTEPDMREISSLPGRTLTEAQLIRRLRSGARCLGIRHAGRIVAFTWFRLSHLSFGDHPLFDLHDDEAALFDAYTVEEMRGNGLAPYMRYRCYEDLARMGRTRCYSVTIRFNAPAVRFKKKLGATVVAKGTFFNVFGRQSHQLSWLASRDSSNSPTLP